MKRNAWWAVALSEEVGSRKPLAVVCNGEALVLFRDSTGTAVALEDRCPHRRVPLSVGTVEQGRLQCAYHGWTFDGGNGACVAIPNLAAHERVPERYGARAYAVREQGGFVHAWLGAAAPAQEVPAVPSSPPGRELTGSALVSLARDEYLAAMLDGPDALLAFDGVRITDFFLGDVRAEGDSRVLERGAVWTGQMPGPSFVTDHPLTVRTAVPLAGGVIEVQLLAADATPLVSLQIAACAHRRGTTRLSWRGRLHSTAIAGAPLRWRLARHLGRPPFQVFPAIDGAALSALLIQPSLELAGVPARIAA